MQHKRFYHLISSPTVRVMALSLLLLAFSTPLAVHAGCTFATYDGGVTRAWTCTGAVSGTITGLGHADDFEFDDTVTGSLIIDAGGITTSGEYDELSFFSVTKDVTVDLTNQTGYQTVFTGLQIWFQNFNQTGIIGGSGNDTLTGTDYKDLLQGQNGNDNINGGGGDDLIQGMNGSDTLYGGDGDDLIQGGSGSEYVYAGAGNDTVYGGDGNDWIEGGSGNDTLYGENDEDTLMGESGNDTMDGGAGSQDWFEDNTTLGLTVNLITGTATGNGTDTFTNIENMDLGNGDDTLIGDNGDNKLYGDGGNDTFIGNGGSDAMEGWGGIDTRADTNSADCAGDYMAQVEIDNCVAVIPVPPTPAPVTGGSAPVGTDICITERTRVAIGERNTLLIFSDFSTTPNGMIITQIPLGSLPAPTDAQKAENAWVGLISKDSEFAPGWSIYLYWHESHYGVTIYKDGGKTVFDDTGAICGWF